MKLLVTGAGGFVGRHLIPDLESAGHLVVPTDAPDVDLRNAPAVDELVRRVQPEGCIHLGGIAFVPKGWSDPQFVFSVNTGGTVNLLEAFRKNAPAARFVYISSAQVYGHAPRARAISEEDALEPDSLYAVSKMTADLAALLYAKRYGIPAMAARPCNHIGPGQSRDFVVSSFAAQVAEIKAGRRAPLVRVGNLESEREFADVRDIVRAYRLILEKGIAGRAYNIATGRFVKVRFILEKLAEFGGVQPMIEVDPQRYRPTDTQPRLDTARITADANWRPLRTLEQSLQDILAASFLAPLGTKPGAGGGT